MRHYSAVKTDAGHFVMHNETGELLHDMPLDADTAVKAARMMHDEDVAKILKAKSQMKSDSYKAPSGKGK